MSKFPYYFHLCTLGLIRLIKSLSIVFQVFVNHSRFVSCPKNRPVLLVES